MTNTNDNNFPNVHTGVTPLAVYQKKRVRQQLAQADQSDQNPYETVAAAQVKKTSVLSRRPIFVFLSLLLLAALACQAPTALQERAVDNEAVVAAAVATIQANQANAPQPVVNATSLNTSSDSMVVSDLEQVLTTIYEQVNPAVVYILVQSDFGVTLGSGSGFLYDNQGHIVTNNHVVADGTTLEVAFWNGTRSRATVVGTDVDSDLAVIKAESVPEGVTPIPLGDSEAVRPGQFVVTIGNPFGEVGSMSIGIVSGLGRTLESQRVLDGGGRYSLPRVLQTDAAINPGNSGGPLLNLAGQVIGVNSAILTTTGTNSGVGFSIPVAAVHRIVPALIADGRYTYPYIGISMAPQLDLQTLNQLNLPLNGVYITSVVPGSPAATARLVGNAGRGGDYILAVDGNPVRDSSELISYLVFETEVGQTIELTVLRNGKEIVVPLTLSARP
ncbi:MAG: trypsin-like peptidase domain-containing protein [Anaerolinea sp.]|nr:trypsin-like peptidase domain-containing protein [Anaerolinea sp.]